jgi:hypothetical protein
MVRWYFRAVDSQSRTSRWPIFSAPTQTEFLGTIVEPTNLVSKLPIVHLFAPASVLQSGPPPRLALEMFRTRFAAFRFS